LFQGLNVVDCRSFIAAPTAATVLSDFGADRKAIRAEPVSAVYEQGHVHHVGAFQQLGARPHYVGNTGDSLAIADRLAKADPNNAEWQRDLSISYNKVGDVLVAQGDLTDALKSYRDSQIRTY
jgi:phage terminase large subunit-like protein